MNDQKNCPGSLTTMAGGILYGTYNVPNEVCMELIGFTPSESTGIAFTVSSRARRSDDHVVRFIVTPESIGWRVERQKEPFDRELKG